VQVQATDPAHPIGTIARADFTLRNYLDLLLSQAEPAGQTALFVNEMIAKFAPDPEPTPQEVVVQQEAAADQVNAEESGTSTPPAQG